MYICVDVWQKTTQYCKAIILQLKIWENGIETCEMSCMKRDASPGSVHDAGCLGLVRWEGPGGWYGQVGREEGSGW